MYLVHVISFIKVAFLCTGVEKNNNDCKKHYFSSSRHDPTVDILQTEAILEMLTHETETIPSCQQQKRAYSKRDHDYWEGGGIQEARAAKRHHSD